MGQTGSSTEKGKVRHSFLPFTKWVDKQMSNLLLRSQKELADVYALRWNEFEFLISNTVSFHDTRDLFNNVFDSDGNKLVDKLEVLCVIALHSALSTHDKIEFIFELFNFNDKGYLTRAEVSLLLRTVTGGIFKTDRNFVPPSKPVMDNLIETVFRFAKKDKSSVRKPELIDFVAETNDARLFMDAWRGIASQVLLSKSQPWRDISFQANITSVTPSVHWHDRGMPPESFIHWLRLCHIGHGGGTVGSNTLFTHTSTTLKTADKKLVYSGMGCVAQGSLEQGMLANRWIMNAISMLCSRPLFVPRLFASTGQEDDGRHCVQIYEGVGWKTVFIDDYIPCGPSYRPLFMNSSDLNESWVLLLEKALAKYLGSYAFIGHCSTRSDSTLKAIQWLTGGHPVIYPVCDYDWTSVAAEVETKDGASYAFDIFDEGSFISFARSETLLQVTRTTNMINDGEEYAPHGRVFPVVGHVIDHGYKILILRDIWNLFPYDVTNFDAPDMDSGHCRVIRIRAEDIPNYFDMMIVSRFPDNARVNAKSSKLQPWKSMVCRASSEGVTKPARFLLEVKNEKFDYKPVVFKNGKVVPEKKTNSYSDPTTLKGKQKDIGASLDNPIGIPEEEVVLLEEQRKDIAFTISSGTEWSIAGDPTNRPQIRIRIVPSERTLYKLQDRRAQLRAKVIKAKIANLKRTMHVRKQQRIAQEKELAELAAAKAAMEINGDDDTGSNDSEETESVKSARPVATEEVNESDKDIKATDPYVSKKPKAPRRKKEKIYKLPGTLSLREQAQKTIRAHRRRLRDFFQHEFAAEQCWLSDVVPLLQGTYYIYADIQYCKNEFDLDKNANTIIRNTNESDYSVVDKASAARTDLADSYRAVMARSPWKDSLHDGSHDDYAPKVFMHMSSTSNFTVTALPTNNPTPRGDSKKHKRPHSRLKSRMSYPLESVSDVPVPINTWPLMTESQEEASSRGLSNLLSQVRGDAIELNAVVRKIIRRKVRQYKSVKQATSKEVL